MLIDKSELERRCKTATDKESLTVAERRCVAAPYAGGPCCPGHWAGAGPAPRPEREIRLGEKLAAHTQRGIEALLGGDPLERIERKRQLLDEGFRAGLAAMTGEEVEK